MLPITLGTIPSIYSPFSVNPGLYAIVVDSIIGFSDIV